MTAQDYPAWPLRPHSALRVRQNGATAASGPVLPPRPRSAVSTGYEAGKTARPRLRLGRPPTDMALAGPRAHSAVVPPACCERKRSTSTASASTRDTEQGGATVGGYEPTSSEPWHESNDGLESSLHAGITTSAASAVATVPVGTAAAAVRAQQRTPHISPGDADVECAVEEDGPWRHQMRAVLPRQSSSSGVASRPSSAHIVAQSARRLPLTSIAFAEQARPKTAHPGARTSLPGDSNAAGEPCARQPQQGQPAQGLGKRSLSASAIRGHSQLQDGLVAGKYRTLHYLGRGTSASVWEAEDESTGEHLAIKVFDKHKGNWNSRQRQAFREARLLESLKHPAIIKVCETVDSPFKFYIIMELVVGGSLRELVKSQSTPGLGEAMSRDLFEQICEGVRHLHARNIVHRDLKLENMLLNSATGGVKLIDFGFAIQLKSPDQRLRVFCGTPSYMAPELVMGKEYSGFCTDMWALGVVLFGMLVGQVPFQGQTESQLYAKIRRGAFRIPDGVSDLPRRLIAGILRIDAASRPTAEQAVQHRWVRPDGLEANDAPVWSGVASHGSRPSSVPAHVRRQRTAYS